MNRKDVTADLSEKVAKKLRRQFAIVAQEVWVDPDHRVDFVAFSPGSGGRNAALEHGKRPSDASREEPEGRFDTLPALGDADGLVLEVANDVGCVQRDRREL